MLCECWDSEQATCVECGADDAECAQWVVEASDEWMALCPVLWSHLNLVATERELAQYMIAVKSVHNNSTE